MPYKLRKAKKSAKNHQKSKIPKPINNSTTTMAPENEKNSTVPNPLNSISSESANSSEKTSTESNPLNANSSDALTSIHDRFDAMIISMNSQFDTLRSDLNGSIQSETKTIQDSLDKFKTEIQGKFDSYKREINASLNDMESRVDKNTDSLDTQRSKLVVVNNEILLAQIDINDQEQRKRNYSIKISGFKVESDDVGREVFQKLVLPTIERTYALKNPKPELPTYHQTCDIAHVLPSKPDSIPTIQFKFVTRGVREDFFKQKKAFLQNFNSVNGTNIEAKKDYTAINKECMSNLFSNESVESFWMSGTTIRFTYKSNTSKVLEVKNPFVDDPESMIVPP